MDLFTHDELNELTKHHDQPCVSIFLPTERKGPDVLKGRVRLKNLLSKAEQQLNEQGLAEGNIKRMLAPAWQHVEDEQFWQHQSDGLALFLTEDGMRQFRVPQSFQESVHCRDHFYVNPLLPLLQANGQYYVIAVSQGDVRLLEGTRQGLEELEKDSLPKDLNSALGWWQEQNTSFHSMQQKSGARRGDDTVIYHGHDTDQTEHELKTYFRKIDEVVAETLKGKSAPLLFAGVDYLFPFYQEVNEYPHLQQEMIHGNPDDWNASEIHDRAWKIIEPKLQASEQHLVDQFHERAAHELATADLDTLLTAAQFGLVETLVVSSSARLPGQYNTETQTIIYANKNDEQSEDLIDRAVLMTLESSGEVIGFEKEKLPTELPLFALLRAPLSTVAK